MFVAKTFFFIRTGGGRSIVKIQVFIIIPRRYSRPLVFLKDGAGVFVTIGVPACEAEHGQAQGADKEQGKPEVLGRRSRKPFDV